MDFVGWGMEEERRSTGSANRVPAAEGRVVELAVERSGLDGWKWRGGGNIKSSGSSE